MNDGTITFSTDLDNSRVEKALSNLKKEIEKAENEFESGEDSGLAKTIEEAKVSAGELEKNLAKVAKLKLPTGYDQEAIKYIEDYAEGMGQSQKSANEMKAALEEAKAEVVALEKAGKWFGDDAYDDAVRKLARVKSDLVLYKKELVTGSKPEHSFDKDTMAGKVREAELELARIQATGKGLGTEEYDQAYRKLALLKEEAKAYAAELSKTPQKLQKELEAREKAEKKADDLLQKKLAADQETARLQEIYDTAVISDQKTVDLNKELVQLKERLNDLKKAGLSDGYEEYDQIIQRIKEINAELKVGSRSSDAMGDAINRVDGYMERFVTRVKGLAKRVLIFSVITAALRSLRTWMSKVIRTNEEASAAVARLRGALLTLVQPLVGVIIPAFTLLVNLLAKVASAVAFAFSALFGKTVGQSKDAAKALNKETQALEGVGAAADKAQNNLAGFDDLDVLATDEAAGGGAGTTAEMPSFDLDLSNAESNLDRILNLVKLIGPALLAWKLASGWKDGLVKFIGLFMAFDGAINLVKTTWDAWQNGVDWGNLLGMLGRTAEVAAGLFIALGPKAGLTAAAITLVVSGLAMLATAFHDAGKSGWNLQNTLMAIAGVLGAGLGIAVLTGSWIPLLLAGIGALLLAITTAFGGGEELLEGAKTMLQGFLDFFCGIFAGDMERTVLGIQEIFGGLKTVFDGVIGSVENMFLSFLTWLDQKTKGKFHGIIEYVKSLVTGSCKLATQAVGETVAAIRDIFIGLIHFITGVFTGDWDLAWQGIKEIFKGAWNGIVGLLETACNLVIDGINWSIQKIVDGLNSLIESINDISSKVGIPSIPTIRAHQFDRVEIPRLAQGAVIPPNREFLAVLGDQKSGTNIEAPLETMVEAFRMALEEQQGRGGDIVLKVDGRTLARVTGPYFQAEQRRKGVKLVLGGV